jgi:hypothetical protein
MLDVEIDADKSSRAIRAEKVVGEGAVFLTSGWMAGNGRWRAYESVGRGMDGGG